MSQTAATAVLDTDPYLEAEFVTEMVKQLRAIDTYDTYEGWSVSRIIDPLVLTKERKREIPVIGDPDETTLARVKAFYNAIASLIERKCGLMAVPVINITHEGFGRAFVTVGKLVAVDKTLRDVHRFGFPTLEKMCEQADKAISRALELIEKYQDVARD